MTVYCNEKEFRLYGTCDECGGALYDLEIETGEAACSGCERIEAFDPSQFTSKFYEPPAPIESNPMTNQNTKQDRIYCGDRDRGCGAELTPADLENGACTQCGEPLVAPELPLYQALLLSLAEVRSQREAA